jgi:hypothetical protein
MARIMRCVFSEIVKSIELAFGLALGLAQAGGCHAELYKIDRLHKYHVGLVSKKASRLGLDSDDHDTRVRQAGVTPDFEQDSSPRDTRQMQVQHDQVGHHSAQS